MSNRSLSEEETMTAANITEPRDSLVMEEVFHKAHAEETDTETPSDSDHSSMLNASVSSRGSILRVATLEESLAQLDLDRSCSEDDDTKEKDHVHSKSVTFNEVQVREYPICLGDNPAGNFGCPLTIGWEVQSEGRLSLEDYESSRPARRRSEELRMPSSIREDLLRANGYSRMDIQRGMRLVNIARNQRKRTNETYRLHKAQEIAEKLVRGTLNATVRRQKKKQERVLVEHFRRSAASLVNEQRAARRSTWHASPPQEQEQPRRGTWAAPSSNQETVNVLRALDTAEDSRDLWNTLHNDSGSDRS